MGRAGGRAGLWVLTVNGWDRGPKPRDAQSVASSQQRKPFGAWPESSSVSESFRVRPGASGDGPRCVVGVEPKGHLRPPYSVRVGQEQTYPCCV